MNIDLRLGNVLDVLQTMDTESVHCIVTSPPYWGLRAYGTDPQIWLNGSKACDAHEWNNEGTRRNRWGLDKNLSEMQANQKGNAFEIHQGNTCARCGAWRGELGLEPTPELYVAHIVAVMREARRVLRNDGTLWINLGDSYWGGKGKSGYELPHEAEERRERGETFQTAHNVPGYMDMRPSDGKHPIIKPKDLVGIPWRVAFALQADGWYLRSDIIWHKPNPMPESVTDRPTKSHEYIFLLAKQARYYYDADAVAEPANYDGRKDEMMHGGTKYNAPAVPGQTAHTMAVRGHARWNKDEDGNRVRNRRSVWTVTTQPFKGAHFATFPPDLIEPCILAGCPVGGTVLDPFGGSGTTALVAAQHERNAILIDLKREYLEMARLRISEELGFFANIHASYDIDLESN